MANGRRTKGDGPSGDFAASTSRIDFASAPRRSRFKLFANFSERYGASNFRWCGRSTRNVALFQFRLDTMQFFWPFFSLGAYDYCNILTMYYILWITRVFIFRSLAVCAVCVSFTPILVGRFGGKETTIQIAVRVQCKRFRRLSVRNKEDNKFGAN